MCGDLENLELGDTVEYTLSKGKGNKVSAEKVTKVAAGMRALIPASFNFHNSYLYYLMCEIHCCPHFSEWH